MDIPITQSQDWAKLQDDLGEPNFLKTGNGYQFLAILKLTPVGNYLYCPYGPVASDKHSLKRALAALQTLAREKSAIFIRIEPTDAQAAEYLPNTANSLGLKLHKSKDLNPKETWLLDLTGTDDDLRARLPSRLLRYHKSASKKGITIEQTHNPNDIHHLLTLQKALAKEKGINTFSEHYLQTELKQPFATLYLVKQQIPSPGITSAGGVAEEGASTGLHRRVTPPKGVPRESRAGEEVAAGPAESSILAAGLVFDDATTRYNLQGAQSPQARSLHATGILTIQLILDAKQKGLKTFDFWGIAPDGAPASHPWAGFTAFKKTFAGHQQNHAGTYDLVLSPAKYKLYQALRRFAPLLRK